eukprot:CAMPEP_0172486764 /NCGR_PEP_ID=MMETSP1066-20121228/15492_1 /TAXON_ID=671091 /ORGANISM="Coscinodiscus wailesii, Strain CCMP2513" /LENGTH=153 /DNA_ID=CAMNT_0013252931 /DNA_START=268 /DNA_END=730 /DNA_ORIENTATION=-
MTSQQQNLKQTESNIKNAFFLLTQSLKINELANKTNSPPAPLASPRADTKNEIILRALSDENKLEALQNEKIKILKEEKSLIALIEIEKTNVRLKEDHLDAEWMKFRRGRRVEFRRGKKMELIEEHNFLERAMLKIMYGVVPEFHNTYSTYGA